MNNFGQIVFIFCFVQYLSSYSITLLLGWGEHDDYRCKLCYEHFGVFLQLETMTWKHKATSGFMIERNQGNIFLTFNKMSIVVCTYCDLALPIRKCMWVQRLTKKSLAFLFVSWQENWDKNDNAIQENISCRCQINFQCCRISNHFCINVIFLHNIFPQKNLCLSTTNVGS